MVSIRRVYWSQVLEIERHVMNEYTRKKYRFLSHLPLGCEFALCELDLSSLLSKRTLEEFRGELANRKDARIRQKKHELKEEREAMRNRRIFEVLLLWRQKGKKGEQVC